jgi:CheY-like chemotaxis protein
VLPPDPGRYVVVEVKDTGHGMAPDLLYHAFEPFYTTKATGRGLGLAVVHGILDNHGGGLWVRSSPEHGTTFRVYLPAMTETRSEAKGEVLTTWQGQGTVLVVDFDKSGRSLARNMAKRFGFTVLEARGGLEAISTFRQHRGELALVLLDKDLKGTSALETFRRIRELDSRVPVVLTSAHGEREGFPGKNGPRVGNLRKPYRLVEFQATLQRALEPAPPALLP